MSKGDNRRPRLIPRWLQDIRYDLAFGYITVEQYSKVIEEHENENPRTD